MEMNRTLIAVFAVAAVLLTAPSFAARDNQVQQQSASSIPTDVGGLAPAPIVPAQGAVPANEMSVTGQVMLSTPDELVLHTASGMQRFVVTPDTQMLAGAAEGDTVTVFYTTETNPAKATVVKTSANASEGNVHTTKMAAGPAAGEPPTVTAMNATSEPTTDQPAAANDEQNTMNQPEKPATNSQRMGTKAGITRTTRLPKTASDLPLIGVTGLLALAGAVLVRAARG
jgi:hypothetical protein